MKFVTLVLIFFLLNLSFSIVNTMNLSHYSLQPQQTWINEISKESLHDEEYFQNTAVQQAATNFGFGDFVKVFWLFVKTFSYGVVAPKYVLLQFGVENNVATLFSLPIYLLYSLALAQFVSNRASRSMD